MPKGHGEGSKKTQANKDTPRCKYGHIRCKGGEACEKAYETAKSLSGQPTDWKPEYNSMIIRYFDVSAHYTQNVDDKGRVQLLAGDFRTFEDFAIEIGVHVDTLNEWSKPENRKKYPGFSESYALAKQKQRNFLIQNGVAGAGNSGFIVFMLKNNHGMKDTQDHTNDGQSFGPPVIIDPSTEPFKFQK